LQILDLQGFVFCGSPLKKIIQSLIIKTAIMKTIKASTLALALGLLLSLTTKADRPERSHPEEVARLIMDAASGQH
jgi:hypothetical protein